MRIFLFTDQLYLTLSTDLLFALKEYSHQILSHILWFKKLKQYFCEASHGLNIFCVIVPKTFDIF